MTESISPTGRRAAASSPVETLATTTKPNTARNWNGRALAGGRQSFNNRDGVPGAEAEAEWGGARRPGRGILSGGEWRLMR